MDVVSSAAVMAWAGSGRLNPYCAWERTKGSGPCRAALHAVRCLDGRGQTPSTDASPAGARPFRQAPRRQRHDPAWTTREPQATVWASSPLAYLAATTCSVSALILP